MGELVGERRRETEKERERDREREGGVKQMCQNCIPTMNMNTLCLDTVYRYFEMFHFTYFFFTLRTKRLVKDKNNDRFSHRVATS